MAGAAARSIRFNSGRIGTSTRRGLWPRPIAVSSAAPRTLRAKRSDGSGRRASLSTAFREPAGTCSFRSVNSSSRRRTVPTDAISCAVEISISVRTGQRRHGPQKPRKAATAKVSRICTSVLRSAVPARTKLGTIWLSGYRDSLLAGFQGKCLMDCAGLRHRR
jgi:hypothetical protein